MFNKKINTLVLIILITSLITYIVKIKTNYVPTKYEKGLINYFKEISLQSEYDNNPQKIIKWKQSMLLFVVNNKETKDQVAFIRKVIDEINYLSTDGFKIEFVDTLEKSNSILYLCKKEKVSKLNPEFYKMFSEEIDYEISGLAYSEFNTETYIIDKSLIFINTEYSLDVQKSTILEEITQSLGLAFDSNSYVNSIFYQEKSEKEIIIKEYSQLDRDIVRLLYHPKMKSGFDSIEVKKVILEILKSEKG